MKNISIILFFILLVSFSDAQVDSVRLNKLYFTHYYTDTRDWFTSPLTWKGKDWLKMAAIAGTTTALTALDQPVNDFFQSNQKEGLSSVSKYGLEPMGNYYAYAAMAGFLAHGYYSGDNRSRSTGLLAIESYILSGLLVRIPKYAFGRSRQIGRAHV